MNIFILDANPVKAAEYLCDQHVNKMLLESTQLLCTACHSLGISFLGQYKSTHKNHPCSKWLLESKHNATWLFEHAVAMSTEREIRYDQWTEHQSLNIAGVSHYMLVNMQSDIFGSAKELTTPKMAMPIACQKTPAFTGKPQTWDDVVESYRAYYKFKQTEWASRGKVMTWTNRQTPEFML